MDFTFFLSNFFYHFHFTFPFSSLNEYVFITADVMSSVDPCERAKFAQDHDYWWDPNGPLWSLHRFNDARVSFLSSHFPNSLSGMEVLDIGCGGGILSYSMARRGANVTGIDISPETVAAAESHRSSGFCGSGEVNFHCATLEDWAAKCATAEKRYDLVMLSEVIEHVTDYRAFLSAAIQCVRKPKQGVDNGKSSGGALFVSTINRNPLAKLTMIDAAERCFGLLPRGTHAYEKFVQPQEVRSVLTNGRMEVVSACGFVPVPHVFPRPRITFSYVKGLTAVNYGMIARFRKR